jgi:hypothetical protein
MNKIKVLAIVLMMGATSLFANPTVDADVTKDEIRKQIIELVEKSVSNFKNEITVTITFTFNTSGEIIITNVESRTKEVLAFIRENINNKKLENPGKVKREYTLPITIK